MTIPLTPITFYPEHTHDPEYWAEIMRDVLVKWDYDYVDNDNGTISWEEEQDVPLPLYIEYHEEVWHHHLMGISYQAIATLLGLGFGTVSRALNFHRRTRNATA